MKRFLDTWLGTVVVVGLLVALTLWVARRGIARWHASKVLATVEWTSNQVAAHGRRMPPQLLAQHLELLRVAGEQAPAEVGIPLARGSQYLLAGKPAAAAHAYEEALALEPRAEIYLNLGRARLALGERVPAEAMLRRALALDPNLESAASRELERAARMTEAEEDDR